MKNTNCIIIYGMGAISRFNLDELIKKFNIKYFVETGTLYGDGIDYALQSPFEHIFSIEIESVLFAKAKEKYTNNSRVTVIEGDSSKILEQLLQQLQGNTIFWLDAHFPGADSNIRTYRECLSYGYNTRLPLEAELKTISKRKQIFNDVLICDDLWLYKDGSFGAGTVDSHAAKHNHNITRSEVTENKNIDFIYKEFSSTHIFKEAYDDQGYLIVLPSNESCNFNTTK